MPENRDRTSNKPRGKKQPALDPVASKAISGHLRRVYDEVVSEPIPDRLKQLLERLSQGDDDQTPGV